MGLGMWMRLEVKQVRLGWEPCSHLTRTPSLSMGRYLFVFRPEAPHRLEIAPVKGGREGSGAVV
jgi:hypothetical protein